MKQLLERTRLTAAMLGKIRDHVGTAAPACPAERSSAEPNDQRPTTKDCLSAIGQSLAQLLKRPEIQIEHLLPILRESAPDFFESEEISGNPRESVAGVSSAISSSTRNDLKSIETEIKYEGYLLQQQRAIERLKSRATHHPAMV
jgi:tRNA uridine 5-carboxymethylaminomethyl modification enzyme